MIPLRLTGRTPVSEAVNGSSSLSAETTQGHVAKWLKAPDCNSGIAGSTLVMTSNASVAQSVERWSENPVVASSILAGGTKYFRFV